MEHQNHNCGNIWGARLDYVSHVSFWYFGVDDYGLFVGHLLNVVNVIIDKVEILLVSVPPEGMHRLLFLLCHAWRAEALKFSIFYLSLN